MNRALYNDKLYALGVMESSVGFYYNKDIIEEAGIEIPDADHPWTWSEFLDILEKLKPLMDEKNGYPLDMTFPVGETSIYYFAPFVWSGGGELVSDDGLTVDGYFNSDQTKAAMEYFRTIVENKYMSAAPIDNLFESGRAAFKFDGAWEVNTIYTSYPDINLGVAPYIVSDDWEGEAIHPHRFLGLCRILRDKGYRRRHRTGQMDERRGQRYPYLGYDEKLPVYLQSI